MARKNIKHSNKNRIHHFMYWNLLHSYLKEKQGLVWLVPDCSITLR